MKNKLALRIILDFVLFYFAMVGVWWIVFPVGIVCVWYYKKFFEFPLSVFAFDIIYSAPREKFYDFGYVYTLIAILLFVIVVILKSTVRKDLWRKDF